MQPTLLASREASLSLGLDHWLLKKNSKDIEKKAREGREQMDVIQRCQKA